MGMPENRPDFYTYGDYVKWPEDERWELIEGRAYAMTPAPNWNHQEVLAYLFASFFNFFQGKPCRVPMTPVDVRLASGEEADESVETVVQPDLLVVCDPKKIDVKGVRGAPDLVLEVLSESTSHRDLGEKLRLYEKHGVRCYIIVDPWSKVVTVRYQEAPGRFGRPEWFTDTDRMPVRIFEGFEIDLAQAFAVI